MFTLGACSSFHDSVNVSSFSLEYNTSKMKDQGIRLQKFLSQAGVCSRRAAERLILQGRVKIDGKVVGRLGTRVDPVTEKVTVDGKAVIMKDKRVYIILNKPRGVVTTVKDPQGRPTVMDLVGHIGQRVYPVGRLDQDSEGLVFLTNDGELAYRLLHPSHKVSKLYRVTVSGTPSEKVLKKLRSGIKLQEMRFQPCKIRVVKSHRFSTVLEIVLTEGRKRQIRRMFKWAGHKVYRLVRLRIGPIKLGDLPPGRWRYLTPDELTELMNQV